MPIEDVNLGTDPTGEGGDTLRAAFAKVNANTALLAGLHIAATDPTPGDDENDGHWAGRRWWNTTDNSVHLALSVAAGAAVWIDLTEAASVTGLTNPLVATLDADRELIKDAAFTGFTDRYYDLDADPDSLISGGVATLVPEHNAYHHAGLASALEITLPDPATVAAGDAPFGVVSIILESGGSVTIGTGQPWTWEKVNPGDPDPVLATDAGTHLRIRYQYDPAAERYAVFPAYLVYTPSGPSVPTEVVYVAGSKTASSTSTSTNQDTHQHTHNFTSTTQDGYLALLVVVLQDSLSTNVPSPSHFDVSITELAKATAFWNNGIWMGYIIPTQNQVDNGIAMTYTYANEAVQIVCLEVHGVDPTTPMADSDAYGADSLTSIGPLSLTTGRDGSLLLAAVMLDENRGQPTTDTANSFTEVHTDAGGSARGGNIVSVREVATAGTYSTPVYGAATADRMNTVAVALQPPTA